MTAFIEIDISNKWFRVINVKEIDARNSSTYI
jgi:hypothetical protein